MLLNVRHLRNATLPFMRLPCDVLEIIFGMLQDSFDAPSSFETSLQPHPLSINWIRILHVCRVWRNAALSCSSLWTLLSLRNDDAGLGHSQNRLLSFSINATNYNAPGNGVLKTVFSELPRIKELHLFGQLSPAEQKLTCSNNASNLETLSLHASFTSGNRTVAWELPTAFLGHLTSVKFLAMSNLTQYPSTSFRNLRQLHLHKMTYSSTSEGQGLVDVLESNSALEDLLFSDIVLGCIGDLPKPMRSSQSRLRRIAFRCMESRHIRRLLKLLRTSPQVTLSITAGGGCHPTLREIGLREYAHFDSLLAVKKILLNFVDVRSYTLVGAGASSAFRAGSALAKDNIPHVPSLIHLVKDLTTSVSAVEEMWIRTDLDEPYPSLVQAMLYRSEFFTVFQSSALESVNLLVLSPMLGEHTTEILAALKPTAGRRVPCPKLQTLEIHGAQDSVWATLGRVLRVRANADCPVRTLRIYLAYEQMVDTQEPHTFDRWRERARAELEPLVPQVEFLEVDRYPKMHLPPVCESHGRHRWEWQDWTSLGEPGRDTVV